MKTQPCSVCARQVAPKYNTGAWLTWECSHVECPNRRTSSSEGAWVNEAPPERERANPIDRMFERCQ